MGVVVRQENLVDVLAERVVGVGKDGVDTSPGAEVSIGRDVGEGAGVGRYSGRGGDGGELTWKQPNMWASR